MKYTVTEQLYILPLNNNLHGCKSTEAKYQFEVYKTLESRLNIGVVNKFNGTKFTHAVDSKISMVPRSVVNNIMIGSVPKHR